MGNHLSKKDNYDVVVDIDSLLQLKTDGWPVTFPSSVGQTPEENQQLIEATLERSLKDRSLIVCVLGLYNKGKTFVLNRLANSCLGEGNNVQTRGISLVRPRTPQGQRFLMVDIAGFGSPIKVTNSGKDVTNKLEERMVTDRFIEDLVIRLSCAVIVVLNDITLDDQIYLEKLRRAIPSIRKDGENSLIVVHNFSREQDLNKCKEIFRKQVEDNYRDGNWRDETSPSDSFFYCEPGDGYTGMRHVFLGREGDAKSDLVQHNTRVINLIYSWLKAKPEQRTINIIDSVTCLSDELLAQKYMDNPGKMKYSNQHLVLERRESVKLGSAPKSDDSTFRHSFYEPTYTKPAIIDTSKIAPSWDSVITNKHVQVFIEITNWDKNTIKRHWEPKKLILTITADKPLPVEYKDGTARVGIYYGPISMTIDLNKIPDCPALKKPSWDDKRMKEDNVLCITFEIEDCGDF